ncbi:glycosyl hydrolase family 61-domain-containing protein [Daedaleopsis nitida]|nr:glycosyl hydrolase family 61-domain-containing protein [Daedaleopsis nitida]
MKNLSIFAALAALPLVAAHGFVSQVVIDGKAYAGNPPGENKGASPIRIISDNGPVKGASNQDLFCGLKAQPAEMVVPANSGSKVSFQWMAGGGQNWPHNTGPMMTYMASCGSTTCDKFDDHNAEWFKIDEAGKKPNDDSTWVQADLMKGDSYSLNLPDNLAPGDYLIRHEIIALHLAVTKGGAEFYPSCTQVRIGGNGNGTPSSDETVTFPGGYSDTDPGIFDPTVFDSDSKYVFPGPPISKLAATDGESSAPVTASAAFPSASGSSTGEGGNGNASATSSSPAATASTKSTSGSSSAKCHLKKRSADNSTDGSTLYPRHISRVMARLLHGSRH